MTQDVFTQTFTSGILYAGLASLFGLGIGSAIELIKYMGGVK